MPSCSQSCIHSWIACSLFPFLFHALVYPFIYEQEALKPILLRRMKEDVENLPEKEEVVVWVQLTHQQRAYYKALYSNQVRLNRCAAQVQT